MFLKLDLFGQKVYIVSHFEIYSMGRVSHVVTRTLTWGREDSISSAKIQTKKILKNCIFASFQGDLACSWPGIEATNSFVTYPAKTLYFGLPGVQYQFCCINYEKIFTFKYYFENYIECLESN